MAGELRIEVPGQRRLRPRERDVVDAFLREVMVRAQARGWWWSLATNEHGEAWRLVVREVRDGE